MTFILLKVGLVILPFYELLVKICPFAGVQTPDTRYAKTFLGVWLALAIGVSALFSGEIRKCKNRWVLLFLLFIPLNIHLAPQYNIELNGVMSPNYWVWKPFVMYLVYFLMFLSVQSLNITKDSFKSLLNIMVWCALVMSGYVLLQNFGWDQFFTKRIGDEFIQVTKPITVGTLGNSTIVSPYIAMIIPLALYLRRYLTAIVLICAVVATQSAMAMGAMIVSLLAYSCLRWKIRGVFWVFLALVLSLSVLNGIRVLKPAIFKEMTNKISNDNGRTLVWTGIVKSMKETEFGMVTKSRYPYTGLGIGSFPILMKQELKTHFDKAHNEYLQIFSEMGIIGLFLFLAAIGYMVKTAIFSLNPEIDALLSSFLCVALVALGSFPWQIAPIIYLTIIITGLLSNENILRRIT